MRRGPFAVLAVLGMLAAGATPATAASGEAGLSSHERALVKRIEAHIEALDTLRARFRQQSSNGTTATGTVWLDRPGKVRFEYDPPKDLVMVANGTWLLYFNRRLDQTSYIPVGETPLYPLLQKDVRILGSGAFQVVEVTEADGTLRATVVRGGGQAGRPGSLTLVFRQAPMRLVRWRLVDQHGTTTTVTLLRAERGIPIPAERFSFRAMDLPEPQRRGK